MRPRDHLTDATAHEPTPAIPVDAEDRNNMTASTGECCPPPADAESFACSLSEKEVGEVGALLATVAGYSIAPPRRTADGYSLRLAASDDARAALSEFVRRDKECCAFLEFEVAEDHGQLGLEVSGPPAAAELLDLCFAAARHGAAAAREEIA